MNYLRFSDIIFSYIFLHFINIIITSIIIILSYNEIFVYKFEILPIQISVYRCIMLYVYFFYIWYTL